MTFFGGNAARLVIFLSPKDVWAEHHITRLVEWLSFSLFSAHISNGKGKYLNQTGFVYKNSQAPNLYL